MEILRNFPTYQCLQRGVRGFLFCLSLELFAKIKKGLVSTHSQKPGLSKTQDLNKIKKSRTPLCRHLQVGIVCKISAKILNSVVVGARQKFQFVRKITWFLGNNRALSKSK